jgi:hypothetical protein
VPDATWFAAKKAEAKLAFSQQSRSRRLGARGSKLIDSGLVLARQFQQLMQFLMSRLQASAISWFVLLRLQEFAWISAPSTARPYGLT